MPHFTPDGFIYLQPGDVKVPYTFGFTICSSATANDGNIPYGATVSSIAVSTHKADGTAVTDIVVGTPSITSNVITMTLSYPSTSGVGQYHIKMLLTLSTTAVLEFVFGRVVAMDL